MYNKDPDYGWKILYVLILKILITAVLTVVPISFILFKTYSQTNGLNFNLDDVNKIISNKDISKTPVFIANLASFILTPILVDKLKWIKQLETRKKIINIKKLCNQIILGLTLATMLFLLVFLLNNIRLNEIVSWPLGQAKTYITMFIFIIYIYFEERFYRVYFSYLLEKHGKILYPVISNGFFVIMVLNQTGLSLLTLINICLLSAVLYLLYYKFESIAIGTSFRASYAILSFLLMSSNTNKINTQGNGIATGIINSNAVTIGLFVYIIICLLFIWWKRTLRGESDENKKTISKIS